MDASRLFLDGANREAVGAVAVVQRAHVRRVEVQVTTVARRVRNRRPTVAVAADAVRRPRRVVAIPRSRKEDRTARSVVAPLARHLVTIKLPTEIIGKIGGGGIGRIESGAKVRRPGSIAAVIRKARKGVRRRQMVADGRRIVNRLNHHIVVSRRHCIVSAPKIVIGRGAPIVGRRTPVIVEYMRMLDGNADGDLARSRLVERIAVGITALIDRGAGSVAKTGQHRILASELEIRLVTGIYDRMRCLGDRYDLRSPGFRLREANLHAAGVVSRDSAVAPADIDRHHFIRYTLVVGHGPDIAAQLVVRHPDMPAPHDAVARVAHGHDGVALFDRRAPHLEGQAMSVGCECDVRHQIFLILPYEHGIVRRTIRIVVNIRVGDRRIEVIYEGLQYVRAAGLRGIGRSVRTSVLDSIAIDQRE